MTADGTDGSARDQLDLQVPDLRHVQPVPVEGEPVAGEPDRLPVILPGPEPRMSDLAAFPLPGQGVEPVPVGAAGVLACLHQRHRPDLAQPCPLRGGLGERDDAALHLSVGDLLPGRVRLFPQS